MKYLGPIIAAMLITSCSETKNVGQQAEIERLQAESEKLRAEAEQARQQTKINAPTAARLDTLKDAQAEVDAADAALLRQEAEAKRGEAAILERAGKAKNYKPYPDQR